MKSNYYLVLLCMLLMQYNFNMHTFCDNYVVCSYHIQPLSKQSLQESNELVYQATDEIKQYFNKRLYNHNCHSSEQLDSVFFIDFHYHDGLWILHKPLSIDFNEFIEQSKKIYEKYHLQIDFTQESEVKTLGVRTGFDGEYLSLQTFEDYKKKSDIEIDQQIIDLEKKALHEHDYASQIAHLKKIKNMNDYFFWHLQIPTTGLLPSEKYSYLDDRYKPIAWNFLLWDLAPHKGKGARVAIIDTGVSAFNIKDNQLSMLYKKNVNMYAPVNLQEYGYNLVSENGLDPIKQIAINFGNYCDHQKLNMDELIRKLPGWIIEFIKTGNSFQIEQFFIKNAKKSSLSSDEADLNEKGCHQLKDILYGKYGIIPKNGSPSFTVINLDKPYNKSTLLEIIPAPKISGNYDTFAAGHGTFTQGIIHGQPYNNNQGIIGIAPQAEVIMIKAFHDTGTTNKNTLNNALQRAISLHASIVNMSLKITDSIDSYQDAMLQKLIDSIDYVVAASGNDGDDPDLHNKEAYPARFDSVAFDVGAFAYDYGNYSLCSFTQKEKNIGPKFVAPGYDIFSATLTPDQKLDSMYAFMSGTSVAAPIITGFLALALGEFQHDFTKQEILKVIYKFSIKLHKNWGNDTILGTIDMRSALLCLHVLKQLKLLLQKNNAQNYNFKKHFDNLVQAIYVINYYRPLYYQDIIGYSFMKDFAHFRKFTLYHHDHTKSHDLDYFVPSYYKSTQSNIKYACNFITDLIMSIVTQQKNDPKIFKKNMHLKEALQDILFSEKIILFNDIPQESKIRINKILDV